MLKKFVTCFVATALACTAQNEISHNDGTQEFSSRGTQGAGATILMQRLPADQICGVSTILHVATTFTDFDVTTVEMGTLEIRLNDPAGPATGQPDMSPAGLVATTGPMMIAIPPPGGGAVAGQARLTFTFQPGVLLPPSLPGPDGDIYVGWFLTAAPNWANDGLAVQISSNLGGNAGEQMSATTPGYGGVAGQSGLGWQADPATNIPMPMAGNAAFAIGTGFLEDVLQPFADNPSAFTGSIFVPAGTGTGNNPNFGYAGIFPDMLRSGGPDGIGFRLRATAPAGSPTFLFISTGLAVPPLATPAGFICVDAAFMFPGTFVPFLMGFTQVAPGQPASTSQALFGPSPGSVTAAGFSIHGQCLTVNSGTGGGGPRLSSVGTIHF